MLFFVSDQQKCALTKEEKLIDVDKVSQSAFFLTTPLISSSKYLVCAQAQMYFSPKNKSFSTYIGQKNLLKAGSRNKEQKICVCALLDV